jgi:hypothetical protein
MFLFKETSEEVIRSLKTATKSLRQIFNIFFGTPNHNAIMPHKAELQKLAGKKIPLNYRVRISALWGAFQDSM